MSLTLLQRIAGQDSVTEPLDRLMMRPAPGHERDLDTDTALHATATMIRELLELAYVAAGNVQDDRFMSDNEADDQIRAQRKLDELLEAFNAAEVLG